MYLHLNKKVIQFTLKNMLKFYEQLLKQNNKM